MRRTIVLIKLIIIISFCNIIKTKAQVFEDVSSEIGVLHMAIDENEICGGIILIDINNDNFIDLFATGGQSDNHLYLNDQMGGFIDITATCGINLERKIATCGGTVGDVNRDGWDDLFITTDQGFDNYLFLNNGDNTFTNASEQSGLQTGHDVWSTSATFVDINLDGNLDLYVGNYLTYIQKPFHQFVTPDIGIQNELYLNDGAGHFVDVTAQYGLITSRATLAVAAFDFNNDFIPDLFEGNDFGSLNGSNEVFLNNYEKDTLYPAGKRLNLDITMFCMGIAGGDYTNDLKMDYFFTDWNGDQLNFRTGSNNEDCPTFDSFKPSRQDRKIQWGTVFMDYNNDSFLDLFVADGAIVEDYLETMTGYKNDGFGKLSRSAENFGFETEVIGRGLGAADYDNDGDIDLFLANINKNQFSENNLVVYRNNSVNDNNWFKLKLKGTKSNINGYHSTILVYVDDKTLMRYYDGGSSFLTKHESMLTIGIGDAQQVDSVQIIWPGGGTQTEYNFLLKALNTIEEKPDLKQLTRNEFDVSCYDTSTVIIPVVGTVNPLREQILIAIKNNTINISTTNDQEITDLKAFDVAGKNLPVTFISSSNYEIELSTSQTMYVIVVQVKGRLETFKFWVR